MKYHLFQTYNTEKIDELLTKYYHHFLIQGTANNFPFALSFDITTGSDYATQITTSEDLKTMLTALNAQVNCNGYYISFNVDVLDIGVEGLRYYQGSALNTLSLDTLISGIENINDIVKGGL